MLGSGLQTRHLQEKTACRPALVAYHTTNNHQTVPSTIPYKNTAWDRIIFRSLLDTRHQSVPQSTKTYCYVRPHISVPVGATKSYAQHRTREKKNLSVIPKNVGNPASKANLRTRTHLYCHFWCFYSASINGSSKENQRTIKKLHARIYEVATLPLLKGMLRTAEK